MVLDLKRLLFFVLAHTITLPHYYNTEPIDYDLACYD